jgi:uncharacterized protein with PQ loop repeat
MEYKKYQWIAIISGVFAILGFSHLVFNVYYTKKTDHLTFIWLFLVISAQTLLIIYGLLNKSYGIYLPPILLISGLLYILYVKLTYNNLTYENLMYENLTYEK